VSGCTERANIMGKTKYTTAKIAFFLGDITFDIDAIESSSFLDRYWHILVLKNMKKLWKKGF
jgi:hypothetical protein